MIRCYNCGLEGHRTENCPRFGPYWPEPGKTLEDYAELKQIISNKIASDIISEHEEHDEGEVLAPKKKGEPAGKPPGVLELRYRKYNCGFCGAPIGTACISKSTGSPAHAHSSRINQFTGKAPVITA